MTPRDEKYLQMTTTPVEKLVSGFAVPSILTMMVGSIYNLVDTFFVGQLDTQSTAALGVVFSYMGIIQAVAFFFGHGSGNFISRALGSRQDRDAETMAANGFFLALLVTAVVAVLQGVVIAQPISDVCAFLLCLPLCIHAMRHMESRS